MAAGPNTVSGSQVGGQAPLTGGAEDINGAVAGYRDDITSINAAQQNAKTLPDHYGERESFWARVYGKDPGNSTALPGGAQAGGY